MRIGGGEGDESKRNKESRQRRSRGERTRWATKKRLAWNLSGRRGSTCLLGARQCLCPARGRGAAPRSEGWRLATALAMALALAVDRARMSTATLGRRRGTEDDAQAPSSNHQLNEHTRRRPCRAISAADEPMTDATKSHIRHRQCPSNKTNPPPVITQPSQGRPSTALAGSPGTNGTTQPPAS